MAEDSRNKESKGKQEEKKVELSPEQVAELTEMVRMPRILKAGMHLPYGTFFGQVEPFNFAHADIGLLPFGENEVELERLGEISDLMEIGGCHAKYPKSLSEVCRGIVFGETSFDPAKYDMFVASSGARGSIIHLLSNFVGGDRRKVIYGSPNWSFYEVVKLVPDAVPEAVPALSGDEFVQRFSELERKDEVAATIIVDPANPLGYRFSRENIRDLEEIASKHGIHVIFDDVFRGMNVQGDRHSASEYSENGIVVETTSKRFGVRGLGVTWTLVPKHLNIKGMEDFEINCAGCSSIAAAVTDSLHTTNYGERVRNHLINNTNAFVSGAHDYFGGQKGLFTSAFMGMPFIVYHVPRGKYENLAVMHREAQELCGVTSGIDWICPGRKGISKDEELFDGLSYFRICPTKETTSRSYFGGRTFAEIIAKHRKEI